MLKVAKVYLAFTTKAIIVIPKKKRVGLAANGFMMNAWMCPVRTRVCS